MPVPTMHFGAPAPFVVFVTPIGVMMAPCAQPGVANMAGHGAAEVAKAKPPIAKAPRGNAPATAPRCGGTGPRAGRGAAAAEEVVAAVESLYADQLKPFGRILRRRLIERAQARGASCSKKLLGSMREICEASRQLVVAPEHGGDWSATLAGREPCFVDFYSPVDVYPAELWAQVESHFAESDNRLPGSRYECAQVLKTSGLPFVQGRSLGQVCHIVQLAISARSILGYIRGHIVPYRFSHFQAKAMAAEQQLQFSGTSGDGGVLVGWDVLASSLHELLVEAAPAGIALASLKTVFSSRFGLQISETALGYAKLSELLGDARLSDVCMVELRDHGYCVLTRRPFERATVARADVPSPTRSGSGAEDGGHACDADRRAQPRCPAVSGHLGVFQMTLKSEDDDALWGASTEGTAEVSSSMGDVVSSAGTFEAEEVARSGCRHWTTAYPLGVSVRNTFIHMAPATEGSRRRSRTWPSRCIT